MNLILRSRLGCLAAIALNFTPKGSYSIYNSQDAIERDSHIMPKLDSDMLVDKFQYFDSLSCMVASEITLHSSWREPTKYYAE